MAVIDEVLTYAKKQYDAVSDRPWKRYPDYQTLRHKDTGKWFGLFMPVRKNVFGLEGDDFVWILNVKCDPVMAGDLRVNSGIYPAYHMNHEGWLSIFLDGTVPIQMVCNLLDISFELTAPKAVKQELRGPKDWLVPGNPKYYDMIHAFDGRDVIEWKQSSDILVGDAVYMYSAAPYSAILYKTRAIEVRIPSKEDYGLNVRWLMKLKLEHKYDPADYTIAVLRDYGVSYVRGPRSMPKDLVDDLNR